MNSILYVSFTLIKQTKNLILPPPHQVLGRKQSDRIEFTLRLPMTLAAVLAQIFNEHIQVLLKPRLDSDVSALGAHSGPWKPKGQAGKGRGGSCPA